MRNKNYSQQNPSLSAGSIRFSSLVSLGADDEERTERERRKKMLLCCSVSGDELPVGASRFGPELETGAKSRDSRSHVGFATPRSIALVEVEVSTGRWFLAKFLTTVAHESTFYFFSFRERRSLEYQDSTRAKFCGIIFVI